MGLVGVADLLIVAVFALYATQPFGAGFVVVIVTFIVLYGAFGLAAIAWVGARRRSWFWLVSTLPGILILLFAAFSAPYALGHPADALSFGTTLVALVAGIVVVVGSLTAWQEVRRARESWQLRGRAGFIVAGVAGVVVGACLTSALAASATSAGSAGTEPPATTATVTAQDTRFLETSLQAKSGQVLGVYVTNKDSYAHTFDIDSLDIHVPVPPLSTTFVAVKPTSAGSLEFYCAVPGHKDAGMVGTISVQ
jgi:uncharacterized cupredoxin-like copper-binding protein